MGKCATVRSGRRTEGPQCRHPAHESFDLIASLLSPHTPFAEVLAVIREKSIAILSQPRARAVDDFPSCVPRRHATPHRYGSTTAKIPQRNLLHRSPGEETRYRPTVYDPSAAQVDAMMDIAEATGNEVRADRRLRRPCECAVLPLRQGALKVCRMGVSLVSDQALKPSRLSGSDRASQQHHDRRRGGSLVLELMDQSEDHRHFSPAEASRP